MAPPQSGAFTFLAGLATGMAAVFIIMAPILAKGLEAHHHLPPSQRRRRRMIVACCGFAMGALCVTVYALMADTPLYGTLLQLLVFIVGLVLGVVSSVILVSARDIREPEPLASQQDAPDVAGSPDTSSVSVTVVWHQVEPDESEA